MYNGEPVVLAYLHDITMRKINEENLRKATEKLRKSLIGTIQAMSLTVESKDPYTAGHQKRVSNLARVIAQEMGLSKDASDTIRMAGSIHDIGKISITGRDIEQADATYRNRVQPHQDASPVWI
jgi:HD-GYP domain-containing protein (c-di-GMP phosphodiesterase class II)